NGDPIAAALDRPPAERGENADCAEPTHDIVANRNDGRRFGLRRRPFVAEQSRHGGASFIEPPTISPRTLVAVEKHSGMDQPRLLSAELFGAEAVPLEVARTLVGE